VWQPVPGCDLIEIGPETVTSHPPTSGPLGVTSVIVATFRLLASAIRYGLPFIALVTGEAKST
jgi:hypothetical protein